MSKALTDGISKVIATVVAGVLLFFIVDVYLKREFDENRDRKGYDLLIGYADDDIRKTPPDFKGALVHYKKAKEIANENDLSDKRAVDGIERCLTGLQENPKPEPKKPEPDPMQEILAQIAEESAQTNNLNIKMVSVKGGSFTMGSKDGDSDEHETHTVNVPDFYIGKYEVTVGEFKAFIDATNYRTDADKGDGSYIIVGGSWRQKEGVNWKYDVNGNKRPESEYNHPVIHVSWNDAVKYTQWVSEQTGKAYRLPSESEWEFAARGGGASKGYKYAGSDFLGTVGWFLDNANSKTHAVGGKDPNELGIYDMSGNVWEWCVDKWHNDYKGAPDDGSAWVDGSSSHRVVRGGSWYNSAGRCRVSNRAGSSPGYSDSYTGFRLVHSSS